MFNNGNTSKNVTGASVVDGTITNADIDASAAIAQSKLATLAITDSEVADNALSGNKIDGGTISNFASTGIDDNATSNKVTVSDAKTTYGHQIRVPAGGVGLEFGDRGYLTQNGSYDWVIHTNGVASAMTLKSATADLNLNGGIALSGDTAAANTLDDYEEGTWTPAGFGITYTSASGVYTKVGDTVTWSATITFPTTSDTNATRMTLPFTVKSGGNQYRGNLTIGYDTSSVANLTSTHGTGNNYTTFFSHATPVTNADLSASTIFLGGSFKV